jgi:hypothetical protein
MSSLTLVVLAQDHRLGWQSKAMLANMSPRPVDQEKKSAPSKDNNIKRGSNGQVFRNLGVRYQCKTTLAKKIYHAYYHLFSLLLCY